MRLKAMGQDNYRNGFRLTIHENALRIPLRWKTPQLVFVNSMSDLFHEDVPEEFIHRVFEVMKIAQLHQFQILTKRSGRLQDVNPRLSWSENIWMGVSVELEKYAGRIDHLRRTNAAVKFLSLEPLLGPIPRIDLTMIDWVIVGGESGPGSRPLHPDWVLDIRNQCVQADVPFFFKQWGGANKRKTGRLLEGRTWDQMPVKALTKHT